MKVLNWCCFEVNRPHNWESIPHSLEALLSNLANGICWVWTRELNHSGFFVIFVKECSLWNTLERGQPPLTFGPISLVQIIGRNKLHHTLKLMVSFFRAFYEVQVCNRNRNKSVKNTLRIPLYIAKLWSNLLFHLELFPCILSE